MTVEILFCLMSTLENCWIPTYLLWFSTRFQMEKKNIVEVRQVHVWINISRSICTSHLKYDNNFLNFGYDDQIFSNDGCFGIFYRWTISLSG